MSVSYMSKRHMRQDILLTQNRNKLIGTITPQEAKFTVYRDSLRFGDFLNFDGARFAYRGSLLLFSN